MVEAPRMHEDEAGDKKHESGAIETVDAASDVVAMAFDTVGSLGALRSGKSYAADSVDTSIFPDLDFGAVADVGSAIGSVFDGF